MRYGRAHAGSRAAIQVSGTAKTMNATVETTTVATGNRRKSGSRYDARTAVKRTSGRLLRYVAAAAHAEPAGDDLGASEAIASIARRNVAAERSVDAARMMRVRRRQRSRAAGARRRGHSRRRGSRIASRRAARVAAARVPTRARGPA